jgi:uncharacterized membrane protein
VKTSGFLAAASSVRIVLVPVIMALIVMDDNDAGTLSIVAGVLFAVAAITDFFDGYLARRWNVTRRSGRSSTRRRTSCSSPACSSRSSRSSGSPPGSP